MKSKIRKEDKEGGDGGDFARGHGDGDIFFKKDEIDLSLLRIEFFQFIISLNQDKGVEVDVLIELCRESIDLLKGRERKK